MARRLGRTPSETSALLVEEALRQAEFGHIEFRDSPVGRQAYIKGSSLAVWEVVMLAQCYEMDATKTASHVEWHPYRVKAALAYAEAFPQEIHAAIEDASIVSDFATVSRMLPQTQLLEVALTSTEDHF